MSGSYLESSLSGLAAVYGWNEVIAAIERLMRREVQVTKRCWYTKKPLAHNHICLYCKHPKCPIAGGRK